MIERSVESGRSRLEAVVKTMPQWAKDDLNRRRRENDLPEIQTRAVPNTEGTVAQLAQNEFALLSRKCQLLREEMKQLIS